MRSEPTRGRRSLRFDDLSQIVVEVQRLMDGHRTVGQWSLAQVCRHLANSIHGSIDGFDLSRHRIKRFLLAKPMLWVTYRYGIPPGYTVDPRLTPPGDVNLAEAVGELIRAIDRYQSHTGPLQPHPLFARLSPEAWDRLHCFHGAHHLSFVLPERG